MESRRRGARKLLTLALTAVAVAVPASAAQAHTFDVSGWDLYTYSTVYPSSFHATYDPGTPRFRWYSDMAHSNYVRMLHCNGTVWSGWMSIPAHDQTYRYFTNGGAYIQVYANDCEELQGYSAYGDQFNSNGYLLS